MKLFTLLLLTCLSFSAISANALEEPEYEIVATHGDIEFRKYQDYLVAETFVDGSVDRTKAANVAFRRLFKYISGDNSAQAKIEMTAPVQQRQAGVKIDMTAPVTQIQEGEGWTIAFIVPREFDSTSVPMPTNPEVSIRRVNGDLVAALNYSGRWTPRNVERFSSVLLEQLEDKNIEVKGTVMTAYYNSPFSLPFTRRNEVMVSVDKIPTL